MEEKQASTENPSGNKGKGMFWIIAGIVVMGFVGFVFLIAGQSKRTVSQQQTRQTQDQIMPKTENTPATSEGMMAKEVKEFTISGKIFSFTPNTIRVKKGDSVRVVFRNSAGLHNFVIDEFGVRTDVINAGEEAAAEFVADKVGTFKFYCGVGNHRQKGMEGTLVVE